MENFVKQFTEEASSDELRLHIAFTKSVRYKDITLRYVSYSLHTRVYPKVSGLSR
jgi:hypothetical protein